MQGDPWAGLDTLAPKADPWAGLDTLAPQPVQGPERPLAFEPLMQGASSTGAPTPSAPPGLPTPVGNGGPITGLEDVVRGAELGLGSMFGTAGRALARARNVLAPGDTTMAEQQRRIGRAGGLGRELTAQAETHPAPTTLPGQILQGAGGVAPILVGSAIDPALGLAAIGGMAGAGVEDTYNRVRQETGSDVEATEAAVAQIPLEALYLAPVGRLLSGPGGSLARRAIDGMVTGVVGPGAARVLGEAVHEQITKEDAANLGEALKRGLSQAGQEAKINAPLFAFLGAAAHGTAPEEATPPEATADKLAGGQEPTPATSGTTPNLPGTQIPASLESGEHTPLGALPALPPEAAPLPKDLTPSELPTVSPLQGPPARIIPQTQPEARAEPAPVEAQPTVQLGEPAKEPLAVAPEVPGETPQRAPPTALKSATGESALTSLKEKTVAEERELKGLDPIEKAAARGYEDVVWPEATKRMEDDPGLGPRLAAEIAAKARPLSDVDVAILLRNKVQSHNEIKALDAEILKAQETGDTLGEEALQKQRQEASDRDVTAQEAATRATSETGRGLAAIRMMAAEDNSYAGIETEARIAAGGRPLTETERAQIKDLSEQLIAAQKKVAEYESKTAEAQTVKAAREIKKDPARQAKLLSFLEAKAAAAEARIKARGTRAMAGLDPVDMADRVIVGTNLIAHDIAAFAEWSGEMLRKFGETIRPHLEDIFARSKEEYAQALKLPSKQQAQNTRMKGELAKVKGQIEAEPFVPPPKRLVSRVPLDEEGVKLHANLQEARNARARLIQKYEYEHRSPFKKTADVGREILNMPKAIMTAYDFSAVLRQGAFFSFGHPIETVKSFPKMFAATFSERKALEIDVALRNRPHAELGNRAGLELTQLGDAPGKHEEAIRSQWSDYIPGIRASNRAFITFLNMQRATAFDAMVDAIPGGATPEQAKPLANLANVASGRGNPGAAAGAIKAASDVLWSPRLLLSRFQLLMGQPLYRGDAATRTIVAKQYARSLAGLAAVFALGKLAGGKIEDDPRSSDFGKIRFGDTRVDPLAGLSQVTVLASRIATGETKNAAGKIEPVRPPILGEGKGPGFGQSNVADLLARFLRTKLSPTVGVPIDVLSGKDVTGQPVTLGSEAKNLAMPLSFQDILKAMEDQGIPKGVALGILSTFGMGLQSYQDHMPKLPLRGPGMPRLR